ncbi:reduced folate transporter [Antechinus flavipes]|uniref:reduced folate transporter n=1 Tax=Antechinus flavipes TaxID=38775 RepID=UPI002236380E|nr:reduced folate transporter [Antechinus flavipes]
MAPAVADVEKAGPAAPDKSWRFLVFYICFYGFMVQIRPGESFITPYLLGRNFTQEQVTNEITPVLTYSYMAVLVPIFLLTDYLRYKPVLILQSLSYLSVWLLLVLGTSLAAMQLMEFFYGVTMAARVAYSSYIFSLVSPARYQRMAGYSRSAVLLGVFTSSVLGQLCVSVGRVPFLTLHYASLGFLSFGLLLTLFLKRPRRSLFFNRPREAAGASPSELDRMRPEPAAGGAPGRRLLAACKGSTLVRMLLELGGVAREPRLRLWSLWWVLNFAGYYLVIYYVHILWSDTDGSKVYNGAVDAAATLLGALTAFAAGFVRIRWALWSELLIGAVTGLQAGLVLLMYTTRNIWLCYAALVFFRGFHQFLVPIATFQIASSMTKELCALVFGVNTFLATILKTIVTIIVADKRGLGLPVRSQFQVYFGYFTVLAVAYFSGAAYTAVRHCRQSRFHGVPLATELGSPAEAPEKAQSPEEDGVDGVRA